MDFKLLTGDIERIEDINGYILEGRGGDDNANLLDGSAGSDTLDSGGGADTLTVGTGGDVFTVSDGHDVITDFTVSESGAADDDARNNNDFIDLSG